MDRSRIVSRVPLALTVSGLLFLLAVCVPLRAGDAPDVPPAERPANNAALVMITGEKSMIALDDSAVLDVFQRADTWAGEDDSRYRIRFHALPLGGERSTVGILSVDAVGGADAIAYEGYLASAQNRLQEMLSKLYRVDMESRDRDLKDAHRRKEQARQLVAEAQNELHQIHEQALQADWSPESLDKVIAKLREDRLALRVELSGYGARRGQILKHIEETSQKLERAQAGNQEVLDELATIVKLREEQLAYAHELTRSAVASKNEFQEAQVRLSTAKAELAAQRMKIAQAAGSGQFDQLNRQLADVQTEIAAAESKLMFLDEKLLQLGSGQVRQLVQEFDRASRRLQNSLAEEQSAEVELARTQRVLRAAVEPEVVVIRREPQSK
ncbi:MAG: hypothetical protein JXB62_21090 [Pirellulales bacterium]|nr:hypothetical protein [Pirellulales bacterium]